MVEHPDRRFPIAVQLELSGDKEDLEVRLPSTAIRGTVRNADGDPLPGAEVCVGVHSIDGSRTAAPSVMTMDAAGVMSFCGGDVPAQRFHADALGRYVILDAPVGHSLRLTASAKTTLEATKTLVLIDGEEAELDFELGRAGQLILELRTPSGEPVRNQMLSLHWNGPGSQDEHEQVVANESSVHFGGLAPGAWTLKAVSLMDAGTEPTIIEVEIRASEATELTVQVDG